MRQKVEKDHKNSASIVTARGCKDLAARRSILLPFVPKSGKLRGMLDRASLKERDLEYAKARICRAQTVIAGAMGAPLAGMAVEELVASGAKEFLLLGLCGSLNPAFRIGDVVSITKAFSEEGTSRHYFSRKRWFAPSLAMKAGVEERLRAYDLPLVQGTAVTTDAPYRETSGWLARHEARGVGVVDMETSALFALAEFHGVRAAALLVVSDELFTRRWNPGFGEKRFHESLERSFSRFLAP